MKVFILLKLIFSCPQAGHVAKNLLVVPCVDLDMLETQRLTLGLIDTHVLPDEQAEAIAGVLHLLNYWTDIRDDVIKPHQIAAQLSLKVISAMDAAGILCADSPEVREKNVAKLKSMAGGG